MFPPRWLDGGETRSRGIVTTNDVGRYYLEGVDLSAAIGTVMSTKIITGWLKMCAFS